MKHWGFALLLLAFGMVRGQQFEGAARAGLVTSQVDGDGLSGFDKIGLQAGFMTGLALKDPHWEIWMEMMYIMKGARQPNSDTSNGYKSQLNYIEIPLHLVYKYQKLYFEAGPSFSFLVSARESDFNGTIEGNLPYYNFNLGFDVGVTWAFSKDWHLNFRSGISLTPIRDAAAQTGRPFLIEIGGPGERHLWLGTALIYRFSL
jgi:hypothetical protein